MSIITTISLFFSVAVAQPVPQAEPEYEEAASGTPDEYLYDAMPDGPPESQDAPTATAKAAADAATAAAAAATAAAEEAEVSVFWRDRKWTVWSAEHHCELGGSNGLSVGYDYRLGKVDVSFMDASISSLKNGDVRSVSVIWVSGDRVTRGETAKMNALVLGSVGTILKGRVASPTFLDRLAASNGIAFLTGRDVVIKGFKLAGSHVAIVKLKDCAKIISSVRPSDPFAE